jgi:hypothetical protein
VEAAAEVGLADERDGRGVVVLDYDNDGDLDLYVANQNQEAALHRNDLDGRGRWIGFRLSGPGEAIGARVTVEAGGIVQIREVDGGNGYSSQSDRRLLFGLGGADHVDRVEVRWPDGTVQVLGDVRAGAYNAVRR